jgi:hypothetical protein
MYQAHSLIQAEHFTPQLTARLLNIFDATWAECRTKDVHSACSLAAALCTLARSGQHSPDRLSQFARSVAADPRKYRPKLAWPEPSPGQ